MLLLLPDDSQSFHVYLIFVEFGPSYLVHAQLNLAPLAEAGSLPRLSESQSTSAA